MAYTSNMGILQEEGSRVPNASILLYILAGTAMLLALPVLIWQVGVAVIGQFSSRRGQTVCAVPGYRHRFAVVVCARHEEAVIGQLLDSLAAQEYPRELFEVFVIADNCTEDDTAGAARARGATVYERHDLQKVGKGFALRWAIDRIRTDYPGRFDAVCVFDADNLASPGFLARMNGALCAGADVAEGYRDTVNPEESWVSGCYAVYWMLLMRFFYRARQNLGMSCMVCGTGFAFKMGLLGPEGWNTRTVTEDCEFSIQQISAGRRIAFVEDAVFYDEQPTGFMTSLHQRYRWVVGAAQATFFCMKDVRAGIRVRHKGAWDMLAFLLAAPAAMLLMLQGPILFLATSLRPRMAGSALWGMAGCFVISYAVAAFIALICVLLEKKSVRKLWKSILLFPLFMLPMGFMTIPALIRPQVGWRPIEHRRTASIDDVQKMP